MDFDKFIEYNNSNLKKSILLVHSGMPFKHYQGRTGVVFNVTKRAIGVVVNKEVNYKYMPN